MKKILITLLMILVAALNVAAQGVTYKILHENNDTTVKCKVEGISLGSRAVRHIVYEYPSTDADGKPVTISGIVMVPSDVDKGEVPCDGIILFNHATLGSLEDAPSQGGLVFPSGLLANPLKPNYIVVMSDYIGFGSSKDHPYEYLCGHTNGRNSLDGLLAARQMLTDKNIPMGKYLFNVGFSQGGTEAMYIAKLRDTEEKYKNIHFDKTFAGGGVLDIEKAYSEYVRLDKADAMSDIAIMLISVNENYHLGIDYKDLFNEPFASHVQEFLEKKDKDVLRKYGVADLDSLHQLLTPAYMDLESEPAKKLMAKLAEIKISNGWTPDLTQKYFIAHSRHDNYVPVQCSRSLLTWMEDQGFKPSVVPGKTNLQTNMLIFKLKHQPSAIVWGIQTMAAIQFWPVAYYEGGLNRFYYDAVKDMNLMKLVKLLESLGIDLRKIIKNGGLASAMHNRAGSVETVIDNILNLIPNAVDALSKVDLTPRDVAQMLADSGVTTADLVEVAEYLLSGLLSDSENDVYAPALQQLGEKTEAPLYLLKYYEKTLADWLLLGGIDVEYSQWGWGLTE